MLIAEQVAWHRLEAELLSLHTVAAYPVEWPTLEAEAVTVRRGVRLAATCRASATLTVSRTRAPDGLECGIALLTTVRGRRIANAVIGSEPATETALAGVIVRNILAAAECMASPAVAPTVMRTAAIGCACVSITDLNGRKIKMADIAIQPRSRTTVRAQRMRYVYDGLVCSVATSTALAPSRVVSIAAGAADADPDSTSAVTATRMRNATVSAGSTVYLNPVLRSDRKPLFDSAGRRIFRKSRIFEIYTP